jgi:glycosyltransferase involved in cell wall biosynthesis
MDLSVVLITKNQEWNIGRLIESVLEGTSDLALKEVILVDSASTDRTTDIACDYPVRVLRLHPNQRLTAAAGRYTGYKYTTGEFVLFLDGDHELVPGWLPEAFAVFRREPKIGAIAGQIVDVPKATPGHNRHKAQQPTGPVTVTHAKHGGPAVIYRREVFEKVGTFNPYLYSDEEPELCIRIRQGGYYVSYINRQAVFHYTDPGDKIMTLYRRYKRNLYLGSGQSIRYHLHTGMLWPYVKERGHGLIPGLAILAGIVALIGSILARQFVWFALWGLMAMVVLALYTIRNRSFYRTFHSLFKRMLHLAGTIKGFTLEPLSPDTYPRRVDILK